MPLIEAIEKTENMRAGGEGMPMDEVSAAVQSEAELARQNQASLQQLSNLMGGLGT